METVVEKVLQAARVASTLYYRLVLLVGPARSGKTETLRKLSSKTKAPVVNVNLELAHRMLPLAERQRPLYVQCLLDELVQTAAARAADGNTDDRVSLILIDNTELLFDVHLKQDPLRLLQRVSRDTTVVAAWNGTVTDGYLTYAVPGHPEHRRYEVGDLVVVPLT